MKIIYALLALTTVGTTTAIHLRHNNKWEWLDDIGDDVVDFGKGLGNAVVDDAKWQIRNGEAIGQAVGGGAAKGFDAITGHDSTWADNTLHNSKENFKQSGKAAYGVGKNAVVNTYDFGKETMVSEYAMFIKDPYEWTQKCIGEHDGDEAACEEIKKQWGKDSLTHVKDSGEIIASVLAPEAVVGVVGKVAEVAVGAARGAEELGELTEFADLSRSQRAFVKKAAAKGGIPLRDADMALKNNPSVVRAVMEQNGQALQYASDAMKENPDVVMSAVKENYYALRYASDTMQANKEIVTAAVENNGQALEFASDALKNDPDVVMSAVENNYYALHYASAALKNDPEIVTAAVENNGQGLQFASDAMKNDRKVVLAAVENYAGAINYASAALKNDPEIIMAETRASNM